MDQSLLTSHVISMEIAQLKKVERAIGIAVDGANIVRSAVLCAAD
jgi:hypothetical protein